MSHKTSAVLVLGFLSIAAVNPAAAQSDSSSPFDLRSGATFVTQADLIGPREGRSVAHVSVLGLAPSGFVSTDLSPAFDTAAGGTFKTQGSLIGE